MNNQVTNKPKNSITSYLNSQSMQGYLSDVIGNNKEKFVTNLVSVTNQNKTLQECTNMSLVSGALVATTLKLSLNSAFGYAYLVPFKNKALTKEKGYEVKEAQFQIGYKGYIQLALRTGEYSRLNAVPIYKSQFMGWNALTEDLQLNSFDDFDNDEIIGYVAFFRLKNGFEKTMFWSYDKMLNHADTYSQAFNKSIAVKIKNNQINQADMWKYSSFWYKDFDGMALKTMLRQLLSKYGIMSEEMEKAYEYDQSVIVDSSPKYVDNDIPIDATPKAFTMADIDESNQNLEVSKDITTYYPKLLKLGVVKADLNNFIKVSKLTLDNIDMFLVDVSGAAVAVENYYNSKIK